MESQEWALFLWSQQKSPFQPCIHCLISVSETEGVRCHLRCPTGGTGCAAVPYPRWPKSSTLCFDTDMKKRGESRGRESNSKVIKVVQTCCSGRIRCSSLSLRISPGSGRSVFVLLSLQLHWTLDLTLCLHDSQEFWAMECLLCWFIMDGSRLSGYSESEKNAAWIYSLFAHLPGKSWTQIWEMKSSSSFTCLHEQQTLVSRIKKSSCTWCEFGLNHRADGIRCLHHAHICGKYGICF